MPPMCRHSITPITIATTAEVVVAAVATVQAPVLVAHSLPALAAPRQAVSSQKTLAQFLH